MHDHKHLSDEELLLVADEEPGRMLRGAHADLAGCVQCRDRAAELHNAMAEFAQARRSSLDSELPSIAGPRAVLRARLSLISEKKTDIASLLRIPSGFFARALGATALMTMIALAGVSAFRQFGLERERSLQESSPLGVLPNRDFTPGVVRAASFQQICSSAHEDVVKEVSPSQRRKVLEEYGIPAAQANEYEVDYLITPGLGGDDDIRNLWPEPYFTSTWNAHVKDALEERLHEMVCSHQLDLSVAQKAISTNWIAAYQEYVQPSVSNTRANRESARAAALHSIAYEVGRFYRLRSPIKNSSNNGARAIPPKPLQMTHRL